MLLPHIPIYPTENFTSIAVQTSHGLSQSASGSLLATSPSDSCDDLDHCRSLVSIIWSCVVVIFTCIWVAMHRNIPSPKDGRTTVALHRFGMAMIAFIAPELILWWANHQRVAAKYIAKVYKKAGVRWTRAHGFFVLMGGFMKYDKDQPSMVLRPLLFDSGYGTWTPNPEILSRLRDERISITKAEIQDRSQKNSLAKVITIIQTGWFLLQLIARAVEHLAITELEIVTVAYAVLTIAIYYLWWDKPLGIGLGIPINRTLLSIASSSPHISESESMNEKPNRIRAPESRSDGCIRRLIKRTKYVFSHADKQNTFDFFFGPQRRPHDRMGSRVYYPIMWFLWFLVLAFWAESEDSTRQELRMPLLAEFAEENPTDYLFVYIVSFIFGAIHCLAWDFAFPTRVEQILWRTFSLVVLCAPVAMGISHFWSVYRTRLGYFVYFKLVQFLAGRHEAEWSQAVYIPRGSPGRWHTEPSWISRTVLTVAPLLYLIARVGLIVQALMLLRAIPASGYETVQWVDFIPHV